MIRIYDMRSGMVTPVDDPTAAAVREPQRVGHPGELPRLEPVPAASPRPRLTPDLVQADCECFVRSMWHR